MTTVENGDGAKVAQLLRLLPSVEYEDHGELVVEQRQMIATGELQVHIARADPLVWAAVQNLIDWSEGLDWPHLRIDGTLVRIIAHDHEAVYRALGYCRPRGLVLLGWPD